KLSSGANAAGDELEQRMSDLEKASKKDDNGLFGYWKNGIRMDSSSGDFKLKIGGRIQNDWSWFQNATHTVDEATGSDLHAGDDVGNDRNSEYEVTGRVSGRPWIDGNDQWLHLGIAGSHRTPSDEVGGLSTHPELHLAPVFGTGALASNGEWRWEAESAFEM